jgi:hypothetical protein
VNSREPALAIGQRSAKNSKSSRSSSRRTRSAVRCCGLPPASEPCFEDFRSTAVEGASSRCSEAACVAATQLNRPL